MKQVCSVLSVLFSLILCAQKPSVSLSVDTKNAAVGEMITFTVKSNVEGSVNIDFPPNFINGPGTSSGMEQVMDYGSGSVSTIYYLSQNGAFKELGTYVIYAYVKGKKNTYKSNKVTIKIEKNPASGNDDEISKKTLKQPIFGLIKKSKTQLYEGEPLILEAKVYSRLKINGFDGYNSFELEGGAEVHDIDKSQRLLLKDETYQGIHFLSFTCGKQLVFPNRTGKTKIKPFEMALQYNDGGIFSQRVAFTSSSGYIDVLPLPDGAPSDFIGAVGQFDMTYELDKQKLKQGDVAKLSIKITGVGNLHNILKPKLNLPKGLVIYGDPELKEDYEFGSNGADGSITYVYHLRLNTSQIKELEPISISYFDPEKKKYVRVRGEKIPLSVSGEASISQSNPKSAENSVLVSEATKPFEHENLAEEVSFPPALAWGLVFSPLVLAFTALFFVKKKEQASVDSGKELITKPALSSLKEQIQNIQAETAEIKETYLLMEQNIKELGKNYARCSYAPGKTEALALMERHGVDANLVKEFQTVLTRCEEARFAFDEDRQHLKETIHLLLSAYQKI